MAVIDYYLRIAPVLLPHIAARPLTLKRYPDGVTGQHFYNKHAPDHRPGWVRTERLPAPGSTSGRDWVRYVIAGDLPTLIWTANLAGLELHTPMWRLPHVAEPDLLVFDLDPENQRLIVERAGWRESRCRPWRRLGWRVWAFAKTPGGRLQLLAPCPGPLTKVSVMFGFPERLSAIFARGALMTSRCLRARSSSTEPETTPTRPRSRRTRCGPRQPTVSTPVT